MASDSDGSDQTAPVAPAAAPPDDADAPADGSAPASSTDTTSTATTAPACVDPSTVILAYGPNADQSKVSAFTQQVIREVLATLGEESPTITGTVRDAAGQALAMYNGISAKGPDYWRTIYTAAGNAVIDAFEQNGGSDQDTAVAAMEAAINAQGPSSVSLHCADPTQLQVVDIALSSLSNSDAAQQAFQGDSRVAKVIVETSAIHVEIPQAAAPAAPSIQGRGFSPFLIYAIGQIESGWGKALTGGTGDPINRWIAKSKLYKDKKQTQLLPWFANQTGRTVASGAAYPSDVPPQRVGYSKGTPAPFNNTSKEMKYEVSPPAIACKSLSSPSPGFGYGLMQYDAASFWDWLNANDWGDPPTIIGAGVDLLLKCKSDLAAKTSLTGKDLIKAMFCAYNAGSARVAKAVAAGKDPDTVTYGYDSKKKVGYGSIALGYATTLLGKYKTPAGETAPSLDDDTTLQLTSDASKAAFKAALQALGKKSTAQNFADPILAVAAPAAGNT